MNKELQRFHRYALSRVVWPLSIAIGVLVALGWQLAPDTFWSSLIATLTSAAAVGGAFLFIEKKIRVGLWRIAYPEFDFLGTWSGGTQYVHQLVRDPGDRLAFTPFDKSHKIRFKQDCLNVAVDYDATEDFHGWNLTLPLSSQKVGG